MDTMGIVWLIIYSAILIVAVWRLKSSSAEQSHHKQKHNDNNTRHVNGISELKQRFSSIVANSASDVVDDNCGNDTENCDADNSYPHTSSITGEK